MNSLIIITLFVLTAGFNCVIMGILLEVGGYRLWSRISFAFGFLFLLMIAVLEVLVFGGFLSLPQ